MKSIFLTTIPWVAAARATVQGFDISNWQPGMTLADFSNAYASGARFVMIKV